MDGFVDENDIDGLSCRSSTLVANSDITTITVTNEKYKHLGSVFPWSQDLPVTEFFQLQLRRLTSKASRVFMVLVLCDHSICSVGLGITEDVKSLSILGSEGTDNFAFHDSSYMSELASTSAMLVNLSFAHRRRGLTELLQILHCVETSLATRFNLRGGNDIWAWVTLVIFERTFCNWESSVAQLQKYAVVGASVIAAKAEFDSLTNERPSTVCAPPIQASAPPAKEQPEPGSKSMSLLCSILIAEWDSAMRAIGDTLVYESLRDNIRTSLVDAVTQSARATAVQAATAAAHPAARSAARTIAQEGVYNAAWDSVWDVAGVEDDTLGRGGLAYVAGCVAERGAGIPRSGYESDMHLMRASPCASRPGWLTGCEAGWVEGWRAGRRAAMRFSWDASGKGLPLGEWSGDLDAGWDAAWETASLADRHIMRPDVGREVGKTDYNVGWDDGWEFGCQAGYEVGWDSGKDFAKLTARRSWRSARVAARNSAFDRVWDGLGNWGISAVLRKRLEDSSSENTNTLNVSDRLAWDSALNSIWNHAWGGGPPIVQLACAEVARQIVENLDQNGAPGPEITIWSPRKPHDATGKLCTNAMLQSHAMDQFRSLFASNTRIKGDDPKATERNDILDFISQIWAEVRCSAL